MAVWTLTSSDGILQLPRLNQTGVTVAKAIFNLEAQQSLSASDIIFCIKIPNQTWLLDGYITGTAGGDGTVFKLGTAADDDCCIKGGTLSATTQMKRFDASVLPFKVSLSDSANPQYTWLFLTRASGTSTATASINVFVTYAYDGVI